MEYRIDPKSGNKLSALGFGCMRFPRGVTIRMDTDKSEALVLSAIDNGVNYFDTAYIYGESETVLGEILARNNVRDKVFIATKLPHNNCPDYDSFERVFQEQLTRLRTDRIDYYLIHNLPAVAQWRSLCESGIERWIEAKKHLGQIGQIGFSFHGAQTEFFGLLDAYEWDFCQIQYNYMNENYQAGRAGLKKAHELGLPVVIMEPLLGGKLATGLPKKAAKLFRDAAPGQSPASWAFRWLWDQPEVTVVLSGMNGAEQLEDNLSTAKDANTAMPPEMASVFAQVTEVFRESYKVPCTGCNYCMPCPHGVNIPGCFAAFNISYAVGFVSGMQQYVTSTGVNRKGNHSGGRQCEKCGECEAKCPQHIGIIKSLESVMRRLEPFWFSGAMKIVSRVMK